MSTVDVRLARWRKSSYSGSGNDGNCVEIVFTGELIALRDSKNAGGPLLVVPLATFLAAIKGR